MARKVKPPGYTLHKATGQARVRIGGVDHYLGRHGSAESHRLYAELVDTWMASQDEPTVQMTVAQLTMRFMRFAEQYYRKSGQPTSEVQVLRDSLKRLNGIAKDIPASSISPRHVKAVQEQAIAEGLSRNSINHVTRRIRRFVKWGVSEEIVPPNVLVSLQALGDLKAGRSEARETEPVRPVPKEHIEAIRGSVPRVVWGLICFQLATGCRPGEALIIRACDIDMTGPVWLYRPQVHKLQHKGKERVIAIGPGCQELLKSFLGDNPEWPVFAVEGTARAYRRDSYANAVKRACRSAGIPEWSPNQLRHNFATEARKKFGLEAARVTLGHSSAVTSEIYAERDLSQAMVVAAEIG